MGYRPPESKKAILLDALKGRRAVYASAIVIIFINNLLDFVGPQVVRFTVDCVIGGEPIPARLAPYINLIGGIDTLRGRVWLCGAVVALAAALCTAAGCLRNWWTLEPSEYMAKNLRDRLFGHIQRLPFDWHVRIQTGDIIQRCTNDVDMVRNTAANVLPNFARGVFIIISAAALMFSMDPVMAAAGLCLMPLFSITGVVYHRVIGKTFLAVDESEGMLQSAAQENLTGVRVVRAFGRERFEIERFGRRNDDLFDKLIKMGVNLSAFWAFSDLIALAQTVVVVTAGALRCLNGQLTVGTFMVFFSYTMMLLWPARETGRQLSELAKCSISLGRLLDILSQQPEQDAENPLTPSMDAGIAFENVTFSYDGVTPALKNVSFTLERGQTLGVLGGTGSGKSTIAYLLTRLYDLSDPNEEPSGGPVLNTGRITIGGVDIRRIPRGHVRRGVAMVLQEPFLYSKTIGENIRGASNPGADLSARMERAASVAAIHDTVAALDDGYDTRVGERGVTLSGGQKQRVAIARMLLQNAPVMIFDDSLSAVDTQTDARIRDALAEHTAGTTVILISHRVGTLMRADKILVLNGGEVEAEGSHAELISGGMNTYRRVYDLQRAAVEEGGGSQ
ncbi:MAG: ABC transporter ATP-binding protein/permease [Oscillospiraceae bacterium]|nr:ABC transporter ATP-binding protein/permease [Oscillospiraceae bacterium]